ncbi:MAG: nitroreductase [Chloroflexi bacterium]|nr:nitroreductase [Chloroflexota bacterium]MBI1856149.1 nitroreductase [Chloroflexota bacterium]MBI3339528.1 nitroreductase [Chloroflexota bacterium]
MNIIDTIHQRYSAGKMKPEPVSRELIEKLLDAAVQAPNHYKVRPWRFVVLTGNGLNQLGDVMAESLRARFPDLKAEALNKERAKPLRAPLIIAVGVDKPTESKVLEIENICAAAAACQNILLAAHSLGLGAHWRTGDAARDVRVKKFLSFAEDQHLIAFLYIGYPEVMPEPQDRVGFEDRTVWMEK